jgi:SdrD B-like domain
VRRRKRPARPRPATPSPNAAPSNAFTPEKVIDPTCCSAAATGTAGAGANAKFCATGFDAGEAGIADVTVRPQNGAATPSPASVTDAEGRYRFSRLVAGTHRVGIDIATTVRPDAASAATNSPFEDSIATGVRSSDVSPHDARTVITPTPVGSFPTLISARTLASLVDDRYIMVIVRPVDPAEQCRHHPLLSQTVRTRATGALMESALGTTPRQPSTSRSLPAHQLDEGLKPEQKRTEPRPPTQSISTTTPMAGWCTPLSI